MIKKLYHNVTHLWKSRTGPVKQCEAGSDVARSLRPGAKYGTKPGWPGREPDAINSNRYAKSVVVEHNRRLEKRRRLAPAAATSRASRSIRAWKEGGIKITVLKCINAVEKSCRGKCYRNASKPRKDPIWRNVPSGRGA